ncbi:putative transferase caf-17, mitochondrial [Pseudoneurospora amorphoporcata]|uniref:Iron-sulfur cluster assembly factor IBA57 homolog, mitochondrial n=1 Tax=Pseudoneurospora amorphoporcata TaxID=241081 RepID=A0AAN6P6Y9_9PEZI|nr:putative transferase caf-17, mitochondrial [Pseudoneurospora amorphoporcata]
MQPATRSIAVAGPASAALRHRSARAATTPFVCLGCGSVQRRQQQRRPFSATISTQTDLRSGLTKLTSRRLISVSGPDASKFLQGVITNNISAPHNANGFYTGFLTAQGRVVHDVIIYPDELGPEPGKQSFLIEVDADEAVTLHKHIKRYKLRSKFNLNLLGPEERALYHSWNHVDQSGPWNKLVDELQKEGNARAVPDPRVPAFGSRVIVNQTSSSSPLADDDLTPESSYHLRRFLFGIPEGQAEIISGTALPLESNMDVMNGIDFRKGCYVGQELTIRTKHRGVVRKRILPCILYSKGAAPEIPADGPGQLEALEKLLKPEVEEGVKAEMIPQGASIDKVDKKSRSAPGKWLRGIGNVGLALCRLEVMTDTVLPGETPGMYSPEQDFVVSLGGEEGSEVEAKKVKVKAFVPFWLKDVWRIEAEKAEEERRMREELLRDRESDAE